MGFHELSLEFLGRDQAVRTLLVRSCAMSLYFELNHCGDSVALDMDKISMRSSFRQQAHHRPLLRDASLDRERPQELLKLGGKARIVHRRASHSIPSE
jgi:hypothetical protein